MVISIILYTLILFKEDHNYLDSALFYIKILNIILSLLALNGTYVIYYRNKDSIIFYLSLMYYVFQLE